MAAERWIKISVGIRDNWIWADSDYLKWWLDMLMMANYKETRVLTSNNKIEIVGRGELAVSRSFLANRWLVGEQVVRTFLKMLEESDMIIRDTSKNITKISICNYDKYQNIQPTNNQETTQHLTSDQPTLSQRLTSGQPECIEIIDNHRQVIDNNNNNNNPPLSASAYMREKRSFEDIVNEVWTQEYFKVKGTGYTPNWKYHTTDVSDIATFLRQKMEEQHAELNAEEFEKFARLFFVKAYDVADDFQKRNWSLRLVAENFSSIYAELIKPIEETNNSSRYGQSSGRKNGASDTKRAFTDAINALYDQMLGR